MGSALLLSANANNWLLTENILDPSGTIVASARFDDTNPGVAEGFYFYHYDMRGSTTAIVSASGTLQKGYTYDEFGSIEESGNTSFLNEVTFTGSVTDKSTGLQYMNARFYDPGTGRFISQDTYSGNSYDPWTQHLYTYCGNNPINMIDPTGHNFLSSQYWKSQMDDLNLELEGRKIIKQNLEEDLRLYAGQVLSGKEKYSTYEDTLSLWHANEKRLSKLPGKIANAEKNYKIALAVEDIINPYIEDILNFDRSNTSEQVVLEANHFSMYKNKLVIKAPIGKNAGSYGIIVLGDDVQNRNDPIETVKHEWGHTLQFDRMGPIGYFHKVAIPSVTCNILDSHGLLPWNYYSSPWEYEPDITSGAFELREPYNNYEPWANEALRVYGFITSLF